MFSIIPAYTHYFHDYFCHGLMCSTSSSWFDVSSLLRELGACLIIGVINDGTDFTSWKYSFEYPVRESNESFPSDHKGRRNGLFRRLFNRARSLHRGR